MASRQLPPAEDLVLEEEARLQEQQDTAYSADESTPRDPIDAMNDDEREFDENMEDVPAADDM